MNSVPVLGRHDVTETRGGIGEDCDTSGRVLQRGALRRNVRGNKFGGQQAP